MDTSTHPATAPSAVQSLDPSFAKVAPPDAVLRRVGGGYRFTEGPTWWNGRFIFSDIPASKLYAWNGTDAPAVFRDDSGNANGNTTDPRGQLVTCHHGTRCVTRMKEDGAIVTLVSTYKGKRLNSPNDVVVDANLAVWFTDPPYGIRPNQQEQSANRVFRLDDGAAEPVAVIEDMDRPNGLCFSPDGKFLYIANSDAKNAVIRRFSVGADRKSVSGGDVFAKISPGVPDGIRTDRDGRLYVTAGDGVQVFSPEAKPIGKIRTPKPAANCAFGGKNGQTLLITARDEVWAIELLTGLPNGR